MPSQEFSISYTLLVSGVFGRLDSLGGGVFLLFY